MLRSMTGFGRGTAEHDGLTIAVEISAVNHRFCDVVVKLPNALIAAERPLRKLVQQRLDRGRVTVFVQMERARTNGAVQFDEDLARAYVERLRQFGEAYGLTDDLSLSGLLRIGSLWDVQGSDLPDEADLVACVTAAAAPAVDALLTMRRAEGEALEAELLSRYGELERLTDQVADRAPCLPDEYRERLLTRIGELRDMVEIDEQRIAAEVVLFADKGDITEEIVRFRSHLAQCRTLLGGDEPVGRRLDFLCQELNREANTIASKSRDELLGRLAIDMKSHLEKVREQVQNVE